MLCDDDSDSDDNEVPLLTNELHARPLQSKIT